MIAALFQVAIMPLPWAVRRRLLCAVFGYRIDVSAFIGCSIVLADSLRMGPRSKIGHLTLIKSLTRVQIDEFGSLGNLNWVTGFPAGSSVHFLSELDRSPSLVIKRHAAITHRHLIDCTDAVTIGEFSTVAGWGTQILTHAIDLSLSRQSAAPVTIGGYCFVGTRTIFLMGSCLPDRSVLAAGSVLGKAMTVAGGLYGGVPAKFVRSIDIGGSYFSRTRGFVD